MLPEQKKILIITVTLNTAVDKTYTVPNFALDRVHRPTEWRIAAGGKGINVSRVLRELEMDTLAMGFAGGHNGAFIRESLQADGLPNDLVVSSGESRICITVIDPEHGTQTEINENGPVISATELQTLEDRLMDGLNSAEGVVLSGSVPPGIPDDIYARWIKLAHDKGRWAFLDSSGASMAKGMEAQPDFAKPNSREMAELAGGELLTSDEIFEQARGWNLRGIGTMLVSLGRSGAMVTSGNDEWIGIPPQIDFVSAVGSGDAFVAGFLFGKHHGYDIERSLRLAIASGAANAMTFGAGFCSRESIKSLEMQVDVHKPGDALVNG